MQSATQVIQVIPVLGYVAAACSSTSMIPQLIKVWKSKSAKDLAWGTVFMVLFSSTLWLLYGASIRDGPICISSTITLSIVTCVAYLKVMYDRQSKPK